MSSTGALPRSSGPSRERARKLVGVVEDARSDFFRLARNRLVGVIRSNDSLQNSPGPVALPAGEFARQAAAEFFQHPLDRLRRHF